MSGFSVPQIAATRLKTEQMKALIKDGEKPANQTKRMSTMILMIYVSRFLPILSPQKTAIDENIERCIPESARMCESPESLNAFDIFGSVYSLAPLNKASSRPPASFQQYINLLNCNLHNALNLHIFPFLLFSQNELKHFSA